MVNPYRRVAWSVGRSLRHGQVGLPEGLCADVPEDLRQAAVEVIRAEEEVQVEHNHRVDCVCV